ncbi:hypothetical protein AMATHDRAFT_106345, partial [Amanita thiersii Skay4041]
TTLQAKDKKEMRECHTCKKKGHVKKDCWVKGGGKEGQGPKRKKGKEKTNQAQDNNVNSLLNDTLYMASATDFSKYDWILNSGTTSHICT